MMDYVVRFSHTEKDNNSIWVIIYRLTKSAHFIPIRNTHLMDQMVTTYMKEIVRLHEAPVSIMLDWDPIFVSRF